jgi:hypothetical protein
MRPRVSRPIPHPPAFHPSVLTPSPPTRITCIQLPIPISRTPSRYFPQSPDRSLKLRADVCPNPQTDLSNPEADLFPNPHTDLSNVEPMYRQIPRPIIQTSKPMFSLTPDPIFNPFFHSPPLPRHRLVKKAGIGWLRGRASVGYEDRVPYFCLNRTIENERTPGNHTARGTQEIQ